MERVLFGDQFRVSKNSSLKDRASGQDSIPETGDGKAVASLTHGVHAFGGRQARECESKSTLCR